MEQFNDFSSWNGANVNDGQNDAIAASRGTKQMRAFQRENAEYQSDGMDKNGYSSSDGEGQSANQNGMEDNNDDMNDFEFVNGEKVKLNCNYCDKEFNKAFNRKRQQCT